MPIDGLFFIWDSENWQINLYFSVPRSCQDIAYCQNAAGTSREWGFFTYSEIVFLGFVKTHFYSMCILE